MKHRDGFTGYREMEDFQTLVIVKNRNGTLLTLNYRNQDKPDIDIYRNIAIAYREIWEWKHWTMKNAGKETLS